MRFAPLFLEDPPVSTPAPLGGDASIGSFFSKLFDTTDFPARWHCGTWSEAHGWLHILSDFAIFGAYMAIPVVLSIFALRRKDLLFPPVLWLFVAFIALCGFVHLVEGTIFWRPWYRLSGVLKLGTALVSWGTVIALAQVAPTILALPGKARLSDRLRVEARQREAAEEKALQRNEQLERLNQELAAVSSVTMDRELRILDLKREVNALSTRLGQAAPYTVELREP